VTFYDLIRIDGVVKTRCMPRGGILSATNLNGRRKMKQQFRIRFRGVSDFNGADCLKPLESLASVVTLKFNRYYISWKTHRAHLVNPASTEARDS